MPKPILMPMLSPSMTEGTLVRWIKKEGDAVKSGEVIAEVETDKATMDLEAFDTGVLRKILVQEGAKVPINAPIGVIGEKDEAIEDLVKELQAGGQQRAQANAAPAVSAQTQKTSSPKAASPVSRQAPPSGPHNGHVQSRVPAPAPSNVSGRLRASPLAKKIAAESNIPLWGVAGSGPLGRILKRDVIAAAQRSVEGNNVGAAAPAWAPPEPVGKYEAAPLSNMRQTIARRLVESKTQIPHFYLKVEVDAGPLLAVRKTLNEEHAAKAKDAPRLSVNDLLLRATALALRAKPGLNAAFAGDAIWKYQDVNVAFAVAIPDGLVTPVIAQADTKGVLQIHQEARALTARAKEGRLKPQEYTSGTFTVSNLGMLGIEEFYAIINPPQAGILAVGSTVKKPVVTAEGKIVPGERLALTLACDHRVVDGALGAEFLQELRRLIETPALLVG